MILSENETELLRLLRRNARTSVSALAVEMSISRPTVQTMLNKLEDVAIKRYTVELKPEFNGSHFRAFVFMTRDPKKWESVKAKLAGIDEVRSVYTVTGELDSIIELQIPAENFASLDRIMASIVALDGVIKTQTAMVLAETAFDRG